MTTEKRAETATRERLAEVLAQEVFIRSQGWSEWPTLDEITADAPAVIDAVLDALGLEQVGWLSVADEYLYNLYAGPKRGDEPVYRLRENGSLDTEDT